METGCLCKGKSTGRCLCVVYAKAKAPDVVFAYSTAQNAFCFLVGAILNILCPRGRRVFQSKLGVSSSNLHHSPHTGHLGKKIKKGYNLFRTRCTYSQMHFCTPIMNGKTTHSFTCLVKANITNVFNFAHKRRYVYIIIRPQSVHHREHTVSIVKTHDVNFCRPSCKRVRIS